MVDLFTTILVLIPLTALFVGGWLVVGGLRRRYEGDAPHCRRCRYNLTGLYPGAGRCPECGTPVAEKNVSIGIPRRRYRLALVGVLFVATSLPTVIFSWQIYDYFVYFNWNRLKPFGGLVVEADFLASPEASLDRRMQARFELERRCRERLLSEGQVRDLIDICLEKQRQQWSGNTLPGYESRQWMGLMRLLYRNNALTRRDKDRLVGQSIYFDFDVRRKVRRGDRIPIVVNRRWVGINFPYEWEIVERTIGSYTLTADQVTVEPQEGRRGRFLAKEYLDSSGLKSGKYRIRYEIHCSPIRSDDGDRRPADPSVTENTYTVEASLRILPADGPPAYVALNGSEVRTALEKQLTVGWIQYFDEKDNLKRQYRMRFDFSNPLPCGIAAEALLVNDHGEYSCGTILVSKGSRLFRNLTGTTDRSSDARVSVILRAKPALVLDTTNMYTVFGEDLVLGPLQPVRVEQPLQ